MTGDETAPAAPSMQLHVLAGSMCIARLPADADIPGWVRATSWHSVTRTAEELSIVCESRFVPADVRQSGGWRLMQVEGPLDFNLTGILHRITAPMAAEGISLLAVSTYDTDYVLVGEKDLEEAISCLGASGVVVRAPD